MARTYAAAQAIAAFRLRPDLVDPPSDPKLLRQACATESGGSEQRQRHCTASK
jgi:hypothetical protein